MKVEFFLEALTVVDAAEPGALPALGAETGVDTSVWLASDQAPAKIVLFLHGISGVTLTDGEVCAQDETGAWFSLGMLGAVAITTRGKAIKMDWSAYRRLAILGTVGGEDVTLTITARPEREL